MRKEHKFSSIKRYDKNILVAVECICGWGVISRSFRRAMLHLRRHIEEEELNENSSRTW
jgi:hypothetical protein